MEELLAILPPDAVKRHIKKRTILLYQGEVPRSAYIMIRGTAKVYRLNNYGEEQIVSFRLPGDMFPESWLFGRTSSTLFYYEALEDCEVIALDKSTLLKLINSSHALQKRLLNYFINKHTSLLMQVTALGQSRAADKLLLMLFYLMFRYGTETKPNEYTISIALTHTMIGSLMGVTRETTSVELGKLRKKGVVSYTSKQLVVYRQQLERILGDETLTQITLR
ncbi:MAG: Crp/Fnr family transcriptional regulator [Candidatus Saccharimonadales bacterium]